METVRLRQASTYSVRLSVRIVTVLAISLGVAMPGFGGVDGLEDEDNAKLARHKAKIRQTSKQSAQKGIRSGSGRSSDPDKCGSLEVGNVSNNRPGRPVREVTVIVDGPIINANNRCR